MAPLKNKRRKHLNPCKKQFKMIESRLMEISLKIDNYIYKNRPISLQDAALCIEEVSSYKNQYGKDPRIFQVAEKLIRQLKGVIEEQDTTYSWKVKEVIENSIPVCLPSPTYSEREIDVVQEKDPLCDDIEVGGNEFDKENNIIDPSLIEAVAKANIDIATDAYEESTNKRKNNQCDTYDTVDLSDEVNIGSNIIVTKAQINVCNSPIKEIQRSLSQLAIKTGNEEKQKATSLRTVRKVSHGSKYYNQTLTGLEMTRRKSSYGRDYQDRDMTITNGVNEVKNGTVAISKNQTICKFQQVEDTIAQNLPKKRRGRKKAVAKQTELNDSLKEKPKRRRKNKTFKTQQSNDITVNDNKSVSIRSLCRKNNIVLNSVIEIPSNVQNDPISTVYNNNVENDLSWVENIRYIREVAAEDIDPKLKYYDDSFWDTFDLPANWNDQDFLY